MMRKLFLLLVVLCLMVDTALARDFVKDNLDFACQQTKLQLKAMNGEVKNPGTMKADGTVKYIHPKDWRSGFFAGSLWYLYELTGDKFWAENAEKQCEAIKHIQYYKNSHDVGFMMYCSYGNALRLAPQPEYKDILVETARSLCTRFRPGAGVIQSWNIHAGNEKKGWTCPVIIDNMMNLELLFEASKLSGIDSFRNVALSHIEHTLANHFRADGSCYHVIDYDPETGNILHRNTHQGYADESAWSRGQAWAIYGFTMAYRYTHDKRYLLQAQKTFNFMRHHPNMEADCIPYWDMDVPDIKKEERDASSAAIIASALYEMATYVSSKEAKDYLGYAGKILTSLSSSQYRAKLGTNGNFLLMHSVTSKPGHADIDKPLNYADYYFLEALVRSRR